MKRWVRNLAETEINQNLSCLMLKPKPKPKFRSKSCRNQRNKVINLEYGLLENDFIKSCPLETVISKKPGATPDPTGCVWGMGGGVVVWACYRGLYGHSKPGFEIKFEITIFEIIVFEVKPSYQTKA